MQKQQEQPRQHSHDNFTRWSRETIETNKKQKGDHHGNEKEKIKETADLLRSEF